MLSDRIVVNVAGRDPCSCGGKKKEKSEPGATSTGRFAGKLHANFKILRNTSFPRFPFQATENKCTIKTKIFHPALQASDKHRHESSNF
jgi:hypothetical protein